VSGDWFNTAAGAASLMGLILGLVLGAITWLQNRDTKTILAEMDRSTKALMTDMDTGTKALLRDMDRSTKDLLARMETNAEARYRDLKDRLEGETDAP
jgi:hypothetical protein